MVSARKPHILVLGDVIDDIIVTPLAPVREDTDTPARIVQRAGGSAANVACWLGSLGAAVTFVGHVGSADVDRHTNEFAASGVTAQLAGHDDLPTGTIVILVDPDRHNRTMLTERGANLVTGPEDVTDELLASVDHLHFTGYSIFEQAHQHTSQHTGQHAARAPEKALARRRAAETQSMIERAHAAGVTVSLDPGSAGFITDDGGKDAFLMTASGVDVLLPNFDEGVAITGLDSPNAIVRELARRFPVVALTLDRAGSIVLEPGRDPVGVAAIAVDPVDTTGAGDAFSAGFLITWLITSDVAAAASAGAEAASRAITIRGGRPIDNERTRRERALAVQCRNDQVDPEEHGDTAN